MLDNRLQPLWACAPAIAVEFLRRAREHRLPGRGAVREVVAAWQAGRAAPLRKALDTAFPFDPYLLRASAPQLELQRTYIQCALAGPASRAPGAAAAGSLLSFLACMGCSLQRPLRCGRPRMWG